MAIYREKLDIRIVYGTNAVILLFLTFWLSGEKGTKAEEWVGNFLFGRGLLVEEKLNSVIVLNYAMK